MASPLPVEPVRTLLVVEGWTPPSVNKLWKQRHWAVGHRLKKDAANHIRHAQLMSLGRIAPASGRRRVSVTVTIAGRGGMPDPDNVLKVLLDSLKINGLIVDDSAKWCQIGDVTVERGKAKRTVIILEDL